MTLKTMAMALLAALAVAAQGCGNSADPAVATYVRYASDGTLAVFAGSAIDTYGPDLTRKVHVPIVSGGGALFSLSDDGSVAAVGSSQTAGRVGLLDLSGARVPATTALGQSPTGLYSDAPQGLTLSPHGDLLFVVAGVGGQGDMSGMFDTSTGARLWTIEAAYGVRAFFSPDESTLYVLGASPVYGGGLQGFASRAGTIGLNAPLADSVQAFGGVSDPNTLIGVAVSQCSDSYDECSEIDSLSTSDGSVTSQVLLPADTEYAGNANPPAFRCAPAVGLCVLPAVAYDPSFTGVIANMIQVWSLDGTLVQSIEVGGEDVAISPDGKYVAAVVDGDVAVYNVSDGSRVKLLPYRNQIP